MSDIAGIPRAAGRVRRLALALALALVAAGVYAVVLGHDLVEDDPLIVDHVAETIRTGGVAGLLRADFRQSRSISLGYYRPVILASFALDGWLGDGRPFVYHLTNLFLHAGVTVCLAALLALWLGDRLAASCGALLFAVHPVHTETVAFVSGRTDLWAALFCLIATLTWMRVRRGRARHPAVERAMSGLALLLAVLAKETAFMLPPILLAWEALDPVGRESRSQPPAFAPWWRRAAPWAAVYAAAVGAALVLRVGVAGVGFGPDNPGLAAGQIAGVTHGDAALVVGTWLTDLTLLIVPRPMNLAYLDADVRPTVLTMFGALLFIGLCVATARRSAGRVGRVAGLWAVGFLVPVSGIVSFAGYHLHERFLYLPSMATAMLLAGLLHGLPSRRLPRRLVAGMAVTAIAALAAVTPGRAARWATERSLWSAEVAAHPANWVGFFHLAQEDARVGRLDDAIAGFERCTELVPEFAPAQAALGLAYAGAGRYEDALIATREARRLQPGLPAASYNVGVVYRLLDRHAEAATAFRDELAHRPGQPRVLRALAAELLHAGDADAALDAVEEALRQAPGYAEAHLLRGLILVQEGRDDEASDEYRFLSRAAPRLADLMRQVMPDDLDGPGGP